MNSTITLSDGHISAYGLMCGYVDITKRHTDQGHAVEYRLTHNGCSYDIHIRIDGESPGWAPLSNGRRVLAGWAQFDRLTDARAFIRTMSRQATTADNIVSCLATHL